MISDRMPRCECWGRASSNRLFTRRASLWNLRSGRRSSSREQSPSPCPAPGNHYITRRHTWTDRSISRRTRFVENAVTDDVSPAPIAASLTEIKDRARLPGVLVALATRRRSRIQTSNAGTVYRSARCSPFIVDFVSSVYITLFFRARYPV